MFNMKKYIKTTTIESDFVLPNKFDGLTIEVLPTRKIHIHNWRHVETLDYSAEEEIPEIIYDYLNGIL